MLSPSTSNAGPARGTAAGFASVRDLAYCAVFAALIIVLAFVSIPVGAAGVPIVAQNAAIILTGLVLGPRRGLITVTTVLALGLVLPVLAGGRHVIGALAGPTVGYIVGYVVCVIVGGAIAYRAPRSRGVATTVLISVAGICALATQYLCGALGLWARAGLSAMQALAAQVPFVLPDAAKLIVVILVAISVRAAFPQLHQR
ncbi:biotin transporter BioY [Corynebacterium uberis]|uniref:biotin transporter BioY n=1 Tax=Corynebacterium TaxID=1716 RepID=UPI001D09C12B|nr:MULTISPECIES: biotin transporter BioY [Corynebacterium]MCZ9308480.1 biotin transporter BioY [Corynebacterium sp. c6VSa_13]UDL74141.1 biotin transporter BioY [Corynebacterium uberis]UDL74975.1 biotin transporter BioY [Corynebacterium uberis]UDL77190.1 biotin transporter BioY [Corynebacterium uberis]UDL79472.1 biotin transporter BioY [Corynebacterium uberis]